MDLYVGNGFQVDKHEPANDIKSTNQAILNLIVCNDNFFRKDRDKSAITKVKSQSGSSV